MKKLIIILFLIFSINFVNSFFYHIDVLKNEEQNYFILADYHICESKRQEVGNQQRYDLIKWAKILDASLIVEDIASARDEYFKIKLPEKRHLFPIFDYHFVSLHKKRHSPLIYLSKICSDMDIPVTNVEFRIYDKIQSCFIFDRINQEINEIRQYNDNFTAGYSVSLEYYQNFIKNNKKEYNFLANSFIFFESFKTIFNDHNLEELITYYQETLNSEQNADNQLYLTSILSDLKLLNSDRIFLINIWIFYNSLRNYLSIFLDYKILHNMLEQKFTNTIVTVGGSHAKKVTNILNNLGFKIIYTAGDHQFYTKKDLNLDSSALLPLNLDSAFSQIAKWKLQMEDNSYLNNSSWLGVIHNRAFQYTALGALVTAAGAAGYSFV